MANGISNKERDELKEQIREELLKELIKKNRAMLAGIKNEQPQKPKAVTELREYILFELDYRDDEYERKKLQKAINEFIRYLMHEQYLTKLEDSHEAIEIAKDLIAIIKKYDGQDYYHEAAQGANPLTIKAADYQELKNQIKSTIIQSFSNPDYESEHMVATIIDMVCGAAGKAVTADDKEQI